MCGIAGILRTDGKPIPEHWVDALDAGIAWRGPDGSGRFRDRVEFVDEKSGEEHAVEVALVHRRLAIIDIEDGHQPMVSEKGRDETEGLVAVVFNGCIYNHRDLREELENRGHVFVTDHSDTEVLIHGWREWGAELTAHLEGMYAFGLWDRAKRTLAVSRDWCGRKPLYTRQPWRDDEGVIDSDPIFSFASSPYSLLKQPTPAHIRNQTWRKHAQDLTRKWTMEEYLESGYLDFIVPGSELVDIEELLLNTTITVSPGNGLSTESHDDESSPLRAAKLRQVTHGATNADCQVPNGQVSRTAAEQARSRNVLESTTADSPSTISHLLDQAVQRRLIADVPLGCFLSGGVDSSLIACFAKQHKPELKTFTVKMPDGRYDESQHAEQVARHLGTDHHTLDVPMNPADDLIHLIKLMGQPFGDSSILPTYWVSKAARQHVKVALSGDGADELFIGYDRYVAAPHLARHWWWLRCLPTGLFRNASAKSKRHKLHRLKQMAGDYREVGVAALEQIFTQQQIEHLLGASDSDRRESSVPPRDRTDDFVNHSAVRNTHLFPLQELRMMDMQNYLPNDLLRKVDTASMAVGLEVRCPFLDRDLASAALQLPIEDLLPNSQRKGVLRNIAREHLPAAVIDRPKMGFSIPIGEWFRNDFGSMKTLLLDSLISTEPFGEFELDMRFVQQLVDEHMTNREDHSHRLFTLLTLSLWARKRF